MLVVLLGTLLALGTVSLSPTKAYAAVPEVRVALPAGVSLDFSGNGTYAAFGSTIVAGNKITKDAGATWTDIAPIHTTQPVTTNGSSRPTGRSSARGT